MIWVSIALIVVEPVSAFMLASIVVRTHAHHKVPLFLRLPLAALAVGLAVHAAGSIELVMDYRPPRTLAWLGIILPVNAVIWSAYAFMLAHERRVGERRRPPADRRPSVFRHP